MHRREIVRLCVLTKRMNAHFVQGHARSGQGVALNASDSPILRFNGEAIERALLVIENDR
jgi:hypothetical protein